VHFSLPKYRINTDRLQHIAQAKYNHDHEVKFVDQDYAQMMPNEKYHIKP
jgi:hypothetical protein